MEAWLAWAKGPAFVFALSFMVLGLIRHVGITLFEMNRIMRRAGDKSLPSKQIWRATVRWLVPVGKIRDQLVFSATSMIFHVAILIVPLFLAGHIEMWKGYLGFSLPAITNDVADILTLGNATQCQALREDGRHILHGMDGDIDLPAQHGFFDFLDEQAFAANHGQGHVEDLVALGLDLGQ